MAALYTAAVAPTRPWLVVRVFKCLWIRPTGNCQKNRKWFDQMVIIIMKNAAALCKSSFTAPAAKPQTTTRRLNDIYLQPSPLGARHCFRLGFAAVFSCLATSLQGVMSGHFQNHRGEVAHVYILCNTRADIYEQAKRVRLENKQE